MAFKLDASRPIYLQIMEEIKKRAVRGEYGPGDQLPSVRDLAQEMQVNPNTIARVYRELEREEFIFTRRGTGTFITGDGDRIEKERGELGLGAIRRFVRDVGELGLNGNRTKDLVDSVRRELGHRGTDTNDTGKTG